MSAISKRNTLKFKGFTLLEVLIALAVLAISSMAVSRQIGNSIHQQSALSEKTMAMAVADNAISVLMLKSKWPNLGKDDKTISWANREWLVSMDVSSTSEPWLREIKVSVFSQNNDQSSLIELTAYRGQY
ncbi:MAG: general secretion pathway protein I [Pseudohongiellaceae bacterium]|jgi:general secretion pathway protein I